MNKKRITEELKKSRGTGERMPAPEELRAYKDFYGIRSEAERADRSGMPDPAPVRGRRPVRAALAAAALALAVAAVPVGIALTSTGESGAPHRGAESFCESGAPEADRLYTESPREIAPQWERAEGLTVLSALRGGHAVAYSDSAPAILPLAASGGQKTVNVSLACIGGARFSRSVSARFVDLSFKTDEHTGFDTRLYSDFEGVYYDLENDELLCIGYEAARALNAHREDEIKQIFYMLAGNTIIGRIDGALPPERVSVQERLALMQEEYLFAMEHYYTSYTASGGWRGLCEKYPDLAGSSFGLTAGEIAFLDGFFETGAADFSGFGEYGEAIEYDLSNARARALHDGVGSINVLEFGSDPDRALIAIEYSGVDDNNPAQINVSLAFFDREKKMFTRVNDPCNFGDIMMKRSECAIDPGYTTAAFTFFDISEVVAVRLYNVFGDSRTVSTAVAAGGDTVGFSAYGGITLSPNGLYGCCRAAKTDVQSPERWVVFPFDAASQQPARMFNGKLLRFVLNDSAVVLNTSRGIRAYSTATGEDVTDYLFAGDENRLASHEYFAFDADDNGLWRVSLTDGARTLAAPAELYPASLVSGDGSCAYVLDLASGRVEAILVSDGSVGYSVQIDPAFLAEARHADEFSLRSADGGATLVLSYYVRAKAEFDEARFLRLISECDDTGEFALGVADNYDPTVFPICVLPAIKHGGGYLSIAENEDINETFSHIELLGRYYALPYLRGAVANDLLIDEAERVAIARAVAERIVDDLDIDPDGTVHVAYTALESKFGDELNIGQSFVWGEFIPFLREWGVNANPDFLKKFALVNISDSLPSDSPLSGEALGSFTAAVSEKLESAYEPHYSNEYGMYVQIRKSDMFAMRDAVRDWAQNLSAEYAADPESALQKLNAYELPDFSKTFRAPSGSEEINAGL